jgi:hypothetical protein
MAKFCVLYACKQTAIEDKHNDEQDDESPIIAYKVAHGSFISSFVHFYINIKTNKRLQLPPVCLKSFLSTVNPYF